MNGFSWLTSPGVVLYPAGEKSEPQVERLTLVPKPWRYVRSELSGNWNVTLPGLFPGVTDPGYAVLSGVPGVWNIRLSAPGVLSSALSITPGDAGVSWDNRRNIKIFRGDWKISMWTKVSNHIECKDMTCVSKVRSLELLKEKEPWT